MNFFIQVAARFPKTVLIIVSTGCFLFFSGELIFKANSHLSSNTGDALKNYFTYAYHSSQDTSFWHFNGMAFPYGEHVVYTDAIPLLSGILQQLPVLHPYLIGILHGLLFLSFLLTPLFLFNSFRLLGASKQTAFWLSLGTAVLNPQWIKIQQGHFALALGCTIALSIWLLIRWFLNPCWRHSLWMCFVFSLLFFIHPYFGFGAVLLTGVFACFYMFQYRGRTPVLQALLVSVLPLLFFKTLMLLTDRHLNRPALPYGNEVLVENLRSLIDPEFGLLKNWASFMPERPNHYEGHTYLGAGILLWTLAVIIGFLIKRMFIKLPAPVKPLIVCLIVFLMFSFGYHLLVLKQLHLPLSAVLQFRANCRFAWYVYFLSPLLLFAVSKTQWSYFKEKKYFRYLPLCFAAICFFEARFYYQMNAAAFWKFPNLFNAAQLSRSDKNLIASLKNRHFQAQIPLPVYAIGSERFDRAGSEASLYASVIIGYYRKIPILGAWLSRSSHSETASWLELLNDYRLQHPSFSLLNSQNLLLINTPDLKMPQEERLIKRSKTFFATSSYTLGLLARDSLKQNPALWNDQGLKHSPDSSQWIFIAKGSEPPFKWSYLKGLHSFLKIPTGGLRPGTYAFTLHWKSRDSTYKGLAANLIITRSQGSSFTWAYYLPVNRLSGFYKDHYVFECTLHLDSAQYEFLIEGHGGVLYKIENILLRPAEQNIVLESAAGKLYNGYLQ